MNCLTFSEAAKSDPKAQMINFVFKFRALEYILMPCFPFVQYQALHTKMIAPLTTYNLAISAAILHRVIYKHSDAAHTVAI